MSVPTQSRGRAAAAVDFVTSLSRGRRAATRDDSPHMPVKVEDLLARLSADGWVQVRRKGSRRPFHHPTKPGTVTVAGRPGVEVPPGALNPEPSSTSRLVSVDACRTPPCRRTLR